MLHVWNIYPHLAWFMVNVGEFHTWSIWDIYIYINNFNKSPASVFDDCITNGLGSLGELVTPLTFWVFTLRGATGFDEFFQYFPVHPVWCFKKPVWGRERSLVHPVGSLQTRCLWITSNRWLALGMGFLVAHQRHMGVSKNRGTPKSSILIGFSIINHPFWGTPIFGNIHITQ